MHWAWVQSLVMEDPTYCGAQLPLYPIPPQKERTGAQKNTGLSKWQPLLKSGDEVLKDESLLPPNPYTLWEGTWLGPTSRQRSHTNETC